MIVMGEDRGDLGACSVRTIIEGGCRKKKGDRY